MTMPLTGSGNDGALYDQIKIILTDAAPLIGPVVAGGIGWVAGRRKADADVRKTNAETRKAEAEADKAEAETQQIIESILVEKFKEIIDAYEKRCDALERKIAAQDTKIEAQDTKIKDQETEIVSLRKALDEKSARIMQYMTSQTQTVAFVPDPLEEAAPPNTAPPP